MRETRIMVVDDDENVHDLYHAIFGLSEADSETDELLNDIGGSLDLELDLQKETPAYMVDFYTQGEEAIAATEQLMGQGLLYSHAFIDMRMPPGINGLETARILLKLDPEIQIAIVTAYSDYSAEEIKEQIGDQFSYIESPQKQYHVDIK